LPESALKNRFETDEKLYKFDKDDLKNSKYLSDLLKYYIKNSNANGLVKVADAIAIILEQTKIAGFSKEEISNLAFNLMSPEKVLKKEVPYEIYHRYITNLLEIANSLELSKDDIKEYAQSEKVKKSVNTSKKVTTELLYKDLLKKLDEREITESKMRKYIANLLESKYKSSLKKKKKVNRK
jgi:hypothetical protein